MRVERHAPRLRIEYHPPPLLVKKFFAGAFARSSAARAEGLSAAQALDAEALAACGLRVTQTERFFCEPKTEEA